MANNSSDIRNLMNLLESVQTAEPTLLEGWVDNLTQKIHGHLGNKERQQLASRLQKEWSTWLGQTRRKGTMDDMERFMKARIGFKDEDIETVLKNSGFEYGEDAPQTSSSQEPETPAAKQNIKKANTSANSDTKTNSDEPDAEEGTPLPSDLDTKLSDYKDIKLGEKPKNGNVVDTPKSDGGDSKPYNVYQENPKNYMIGNEWDEAKLRKRKSQLKPGEELHLGNRKFRKPWPGDESNNFVDPKSLKTEESINEAEDDIRDAVLAPDQVAELMDASAAQINDEYLYNGPDNDRKDAAAARALSQSGGRNSRASRIGDTNANLGANKGGPKSSGTYDTAEMLDVLQTVNYSKTRVPSLERKVSKATSISEMTDQDMQELALIGFAFLRART